MRPKKDKDLKKISQGIRLESWMVQLMKDNGGVQRYIDSCLKEQSSPVAILILRDLVNAFYSLDHTLLVKSIGNAKYFLSILGIPTIHERGRE